MKLLALFIATFALANGALYPLGEESSSEEFEYQNAESQYPYKRGYPVNEEIPEFFDKNIDIHQSIMEPIPEEFLEPKLGHKVWPVGKEFVYKYQGRVVAGIPGIKEQITGLGLKATLHLQVTSPSTILAKLSNLENGKINRQVPQAEPEFYRGKAHLSWEPLPSEPQQVLSAPFKLILKSGLVVGLEVLAQEPTWSVNLKKGVASQLNVNLQQVNRVPFQLRNAKKYEDKSFRHLPTTAPEHEFYLVQEDSIGGKCKTAYTIVPLENFIAERQEMDLGEEPFEEALYSGPISKPFVVTKVRDFDECDRTPYWIHASMKDISQQPCNPAMASCHRFSARTSISRYLIRKSPLGEHMRVEKVWGESEFTVRPHGAKTERLWSVSNQTLTLKLERPISSKIAPVVAGEYRRTTLRYEFPVQTPASQVNQRLNENPVYEQLRNPDQSIRKTQIKKQYFPEGPKYYPEEQDFYPEGEFVPGEYYSKSEGSYAEEIEREIRQTESMYQNEWEKSLYLRGLKAYYPSLRLPSYYMCPQTASRIVRGSTAMRQVEELVHEVESEIENFEDLAQKESSLKILQIARAVTILSYDEISQIYRQVVSASPSPLSSKTKQTILLDSLVMSGTHPAIMFVKDLIQKGELKGESAAQIVSMIPMSVKTVTPELISELIKLVKSQTVKPSSQPRHTNQVWITTLLAIGNMINHACVSPKTKAFNYAMEPRGATFCSKNHPVITREFIPLLARGLESSQSVWKKMVFIHALGNTGHPEILPVLEPYIHGEAHFDPQVQTKAVFALTRVAEIAPSKVYKVLRPVYANPKRHYAVRMAAFETLVMTAPSPAFFTVAATDTWFEPNQQVASYVYSTLANLANTTIPVYQNISRMAEMALPLAKKTELGIQYSKNYFFSNYVKEQALGSLLQLSSLGSSKSLIPRVLYGRLVKNIGHLNLDMLQGALHVEGLQEVINQLVQSLGPHPFEGAEGLFDYIQRARTTFTSGVTPLAMLQEMNIKVRRDDPVNIAAWFKVFGGMERFVNLNYETLFEILQEASPFVSENGQGYGLNVNYQKAFNLDSMTVILPMDMGVPVYFSSKSPLLISVRGRVEAQTDLSQLMRRSIPTSASIKVDLKPVITQNTLVEMGVICPIAAETFIAGVNTHNLVALPVKTKIHLNAPEKKLVFEAEAASGRLPTVIDLAHFHQRPFTCIKKLADFQPINKVPQTKYIHVVEKPYYNETVVGVHGVGLPVKFVAKIDEPHSPATKIWEKLRKYNPVSAVLYSTTPSTLRQYEYKLTIDTSRSQTKKIKGQIHFRSSKSPVSVWSLEPESEVESELYSYKSTHYPRTESEILEFIRNPSQYWDEAEGPLEYIPFSQIKNLEARKMYESEKYMKDSPLELETELKGHSYQAHAKIELEGPIPRVYRATLMSCANPTLTAAKVSFQAEKEGGISAAPYKLFGTAFVQYPRLPKTPVREALVQSDMTTLAGAFVRFGKEAEHAIKTRVIMTTTPKQKRHAESSQATRRCEYDESKGSPYSSSCMEARLQATTLNKCVIDVRGENIPSYIVNASYAIDNYVKYMMYPYMTVDPIKAQRRNEHDRVKVVVKVEPPTRQQPYSVVDILTYKPLENAFFKTIKMSPLVEPVFPLSAKTKLSTKVLNEILGQQYTPMCRIGERKIETFDNVTVSYPLPPCYHLVAKDCSMRSRVAVLAKQLPEGLKVVKMIAGKHIIEVIPSPSTSRLRPHLKVRLNGAPETPISPSEVKKLKSEGITIVKISKRTDGEITVEAPLKGLKVITDGYIVKVQASNTLRGRLCGLCGDFNGEKLADMKGPAGCVFNNPIAFGRSYALPSEGCQQLPEIESIRYQQRQQQRRIERQTELYERIQDAELEPAFRQQQLERVCEMELYQPLGELVENGLPISKWSRDVEHIFGPEVTNELLLQDSELQDEEAYGRFNPEEELSRPCVRYITKTINKPGKICFSVKPVPECNLSCRPTQLISKELGYHCMPIGDESQKYLAQARFGVVQELVGLSPHLTFATSHPESCEM